LSALAGNTQELHSAVALASGGELFFSEGLVARMTMRQLKDEELEVCQAGEATTTSVGSCQL
jgi:predicted house-cleaning NTP pyrophosphatase (Maf/HAM1 superfamily)